MDKDKMKDDKYDHLCPDDIWCFFADDTDIDCDTCPFAEFK